MSKARAMEIINKRKLDPTEEFKFQEEIVTQDSLNRLSVVELKEKLRRAGLPVSGVKCELIERLLKNQERKTSESPTRESIDSPISKQMVSEKKRRIQKKISELEVIIENIYELEIISRLRIISHRYQLICDRRIKEICELKEFQKDFRLLIKFTNSTVEKQDMQQPILWQGCMCFFNSHPRFNSIPLPNHIEKTEDNWFVFDWKDLRCIVEPMRSLSINDYRKNAVTADHYYFDTMNYSEGIDKLMLLLSK